MTSQEAIEKLTAVFRSVFDDDSIILTPETTSEDIEEWDSLNQIKIILACEKSFRLKLNARKINTLENVGQMIDYVRAEAAAQRGA